MKKAKRLLAALLSVVMILSAAYIPAYAASGDYHQPGVGSDGKYYFSYEQGASWLLDMLDELLLDANIYITLGELDDMVGAGDGLISGDGGFFGTLGISLKLGDYIDAVNLRSVNDLIKTLYGFMECIDENWVAGLADALSLLGDLTNGDKLGTGALNNVGSLNKNVLRGSFKDNEVLEMLVTFLYEKRTLLVGLISGYVGLGSLLSGFLGDLIVDFLPGASIGTVTCDGTETDNALANADIGLKNMLYQMLIDETATSIPDGKTIDDGVQQLVNWALIEGTGTSGSDGGLSLLGEDFEPLMPAIADKPGAAGVLSTGETFSADRNGDGVAESGYTMNTYQFVANLINALMSGMLGPMLSELLCDLVGVEITEQLPYGDPSIMGDQMFSLIIGLVESLLVQNGAPEPEYTDEENTYPKLKIDAMIDWLFNEGGLDTFIKIDYLGIKIQDNFMSLLNDLIRLLVNMLPSLGLFESSAHLGYTADELNAVWGYDENFQLIDENDEASLGQTYITYEDGAFLYPTEISIVDGVEKPTAYNYLYTQMPVNISDKTADDYINPDFIRVNYVVATNQVYATVIKMALNDMIDGCYFPEWTTDIPSVLAYGLAALAAPATPQNNYYARLDAWHEYEVNNPGIAPSDDISDEYIPYSTPKSIPIKDINGNQAVDANGNAIYHVVNVPTGAINIGCSYLAAYFNTLFQLNNHKPFSTDTTLEQFLSEFLLWGFTQYVPLLAGNDADSDGYMDAYIKDAGNKDVAHPYKSGSYLSAIWASDVSSFVKEVANNFEDFRNRVYKANPNWEAVYDLIDATLFGLLPTSWLPDLNGSNQFINEWLLGNLVEFDIQSILGLLSVNTDPNAELNKYPLIPLVIRVLDRILAAVFGDCGLLIPANRTGVVKNDNVTTMTSLDQLLSLRVNGSVSQSSSLAYLLNSLLTFLQAFKTPLLGTFLPLLVSSNYERPYNKDVLTSKLTIEDLEEYVDSFQVNLNADYVASFDNEDDAYAATDGTATVQRTVDATAYEIKLTTGTVYGPYATKAEADELVATFSKCYIYAKKTGVAVNPETGEEEDVYEYQAYRPWTYLETAAKTTATETIDNLYTENYSTYNQFKFANLTATSSSNPNAYYENNQMQFFNYEDWGTSGYLYRNAKDSLKEASTYISTFKSFAENDLPAAYGDWFMYSIRERLWAKDLYDKNDDGRSVLSETDSDYFAATTDETTGEVTDPGYPVDGDPTLPTSMYPFWTTSSQAYTYKDSKTAESITVTMESFKEANYEQLAMAIEYGNENEVVLSTFEAEDVVRLALETLAFDITPHADGSYNAGSAQWNTIVADGRISTVETFCANNGMTLKTDEETGEYIIVRKAFDYTDSLTFGTSGLTTTPITDSVYAGYKDDTMTQTDSYTYADEFKLQVYKSYVEYIEAIYANDRSIYNSYDYISFRFEQAEVNRNKATDTTMLEWIIGLAKTAYKDPTTRRRNLVKIGADEVTGAPITEKVYTTTSYEAFREAYDYAQSLIDACAENILSENELTQSLITEAYVGLLKAYQALIKYTGGADWTQLDTFIATAQSILDDPNKNDPVLGYASGLDILEATLGDATTLRNNEEIDCEAQDDVDQMAAYLNQAIRGLKYNVAPSIVVNTGLGENAVGTVKISSNNNIILGQVFGLKEGKGASMDIITLAGMMEDDETGNSVKIIGSGFGTGTGAYYLGKVGNLERFRYYAVLYGDINGDTRIDGTDATALELYKALGTLSDDEAKYEAADANRDGSVDQLDIDTINKHATFKKLDDGTIFKIDQSEHTSGFTTDDGDSSLIEE